MANRHSASSTWAPLLVTVFRWLWLACPASNVGTWMQTSAPNGCYPRRPRRPRRHSGLAGPDRRHAPDVMFGIVGGVLADTLDGRRLLIAVQRGLVVAGSAARGPHHRWSYDTGAVAHVYVRDRHRFGRGQPRLPVPRAELVPRDQIPAAAQARLIEAGRGVASSKPIVWNTRWSGLPPRLTGPSPNEFYAAPTDTDGCGAGQRFVRAPGDGSSVGKMSRAVYSLSPGSKWCATRARGSLAHVGRLVRLPTRTVRGTGGDPPLMHVYGTLIDHANSAPSIRALTRTFLERTTGFEPATLTLAR